MSRFWKYAKPLIPILILLGCCVPICLGLLPATYIEFPEKFELHPIQLVVIGVCILMSFVIIPRHPSGGVN